MSTLKQALLETEVSLGVWLNSGSSLIAEAMAVPGFQWLVIDMEHSAVGMSQIEPIFAAVERRGLHPIVRIGEQDPLLACRLLDSGAQGLIVSKVEDTDEFQEFAERCIYPPTGVRGVGLGRANLWGDTFENYFQNFAPVLFPMIETKKGVGVAGELAALPAVDGLFLGPYDLSTDLGHPGDMSHPGFQKAVDDVKSACQANGKRAGIHQVQPDQDTLRSRVEEGFCFIAYGTDMLAVRQTFQNIDIS